MSGTPIRKIDEMWQDEGFALNEDYPEPVGGQRVTRFQAYMNRVDWTDPSHVTRALRVFAVALYPLFHPSAGWDGWEPRPGAVDRLRRLLGRDGYEVTDEGEIVARNPKLAVLSPELLTNLTDPDVIHDHLDRIGGAIERNDPAQAIGSAKELIESTAKVVLRETHTNFSEKDDLPDLVRKASRALGINPADRSPGPDGSDAVRKILGAATTIANGMAELRNRGYGTGHGGAVKRVGLSRRHARLAINAARLWCEFALDTLADPRAPWKKAHSAEQP